MPRAKKEAENFSCKITIDIYRLLEEYWSVYMTIFSRLLISPIAIQKPNFPAAPR